MQLYPAIDMKNGQCVRLRQGAFQDIKVYSDDPGKVADYWQEQGASYLHLVDLDGALAGRSVNENVIRAIVKSSRVPVQLGGGIRSEAGVRRMLEAGVTRVIIGTKAVQDPEFIKTMVAKFGSKRIVVGVDAKDGMAAIEGWEKVSRVTALELCRQMKEYGVRHVVYTDISRDGMLSGPNLEYTKKLTDETHMDIIASGGVSSMEDLEKLYAAGIGGVIIGKALYENRVDLREAAARFEERQGE